MSETSTERLARLLALVPWLRANDGITIEQAAEHFGVSADQLTTDLWQLIVCGIPGYGPDQLVDIQFWDDDGIHVIDAIALDRPLRLTGEEVAALHVALRVLAQVPGNHDRQALVSAMAKLEEAGAPPVPIDVRVSIDAAVRAAIDTAVEGAQWLLIEYAAANGDQITERKVRPLHTYAVDDRVYLHAWCEVATDVRTFRLDRIHTAAVTNAPDGVDLTPVTTAISLTPKITPEITQVARIAIDPQAAWIFDTEDVEPVTTSPGEPPQALVRFASLDWLVRWVLGHGGRVQVLEPDSARTAVLEATQQRLAAGPTT
jgi:proteasome accessory factor C